MNEELNLQTGYVVSVTDHRESAVLTADSAPADTELHVDDLDPFLEDGGSAVVVADDGSLRDRITYEGYDEDASTLTGVSGLTDSFSEDDQVLALPKTTTRYAAVIEAEEDAPIGVRIPHALYPFLKTSTRVYDDGTAVRIAFFWDGDEFVAYDVLGAVPAFDAQFITNPESGMREQIRRYRSLPAVSGWVGVLEPLPFAGTVLAIRLHTTLIGGAVAEFQHDGVTFATVTCPDDDFDSGLVIADEPFLAGDTLGVVQGATDGLGDLYAEFRVRRDDP